MTMWRRYRRNVKSKFSLRGVYPPGKVIKLGDYGTYENGSWKHQGNLGDDLGIELKVRTAPPGDAWEVSHNASFDGQVDGEVTQVAKATLSFHGMRSLYVLANAPRYESLANVAEVGRALYEKRAHNPLVWNDAWVFVTAAVQSDSVTCIAAQGNDTKASFQPAAGLLEVVAEKLAKADVSVSVTGDVLVKILKQPAALGIEIGRPEEGTVNLRSVQLMATGSGMLEAYTNVAEEPDVGGDDD